MELANNSFSLSVNDTMYRQVDGISTGCLLGPILTNIFAGFSENILFDRFPKLYI